MGSKLCKMCATMIFFIHRTLMVNSFYITEFNYVGVQLGKVRAFLKKFRPESYDILLSLDQ